MSAALLVAVIIPEKGNWKEAFGSWLKGEGWHSGESIAAGASRWSHHMCHRNSKKWMLVVSRLYPFHSVFLFYSFWDPMGLCQPHSGLIIPSPMNLSGNTLTDTPELQVEWRWRLTRTATFSPDHLQSLRLHSPSPPTHSSQTSIDFHLFKLTNLHIWHMEFLGSVKSNMRLGLSSVGVFNQVLASPSLSLIN